MYSPHLICVFQNVSNGGQDFNEVPKYSLAELQVASEELPQGVDPSAREASLIFNMTTVIIMSCWKKLCSS